MKKKIPGGIIPFCLLMVLFAAGCGTLPIKKYYLLNYIPTPPQARLNEAPYPFTLRLKEFSIEDAYARPQIVYRQSPYELQFYFYQVWAVKPAQMINDLVFKHLAAMNLIRAVVRRYDGGAKPDFELSGAIEAIDEYDSEEVWFAHMALRFRLTRLTDGRVIYTRRFDNRKRVFQNNPQNVVKEMSAIMEFIMDQVVGDLDTILSNENGHPGNPIQPVPESEAPVMDLPADSGKTGAR
ncbi:MAG: hypothetical protein A2293_17210 [Elusimicrobia bacterium RIFOXYB2_FULL_49_7]|nr:MAG: hypothetical protein A2293_17210 [Elusimicrobia bacterium RIFOXYB2_FULL_49_7]